MRNPNNNYENPLHPGWRWVKLGEVCEIATGGTPKTGIAEYYGGNIAWMKSGDVKGTYIDDATHHISEEGLQNSNAQVHPQGTVVLAMSGQGKTRGLSAILRIEAACSQSVAAIMPSEYLLPEIIHYWLMAHYDDTRGITGDNERSGLNLRLVRNIFIPLPPLSEQKRIAATLNKQMAAVKKAREAAEAQLGAAKALPVAYLRQIFPKEGQKLPQGWRWVTLNSVCDVVNGFGFPEHLQGRKDLPYPFIKVSDMNALGAEVVVSSAVNTVDKDILDNLRARIYPSRTIIFPKVGGALLTNKKRILGKDSCFDNNIMGLVPRDADADFLFCWFQTVDLRTLCNIQALPSIKQSRIATLKYPMPANAEQKRIAAILNEQMASAERLRNNLKKQLHEINSLPAALLKRAFNGEL